MTDFTKLIAGRLGLTEHSVAATLGLLDDGATVPFISRYRKEATGGLDEVAVRSIETLAESLRELDKRKAYITGVITEAGSMTPELAARIADCWDAAEIEDIYLPFKPKRRTRATVARELGLEPLAKMIMSGSSPDPVRPPDVLSATRSLTATPP